MYQVRYDDTGRERSILYRAEQGPDNIAERGVLEQLFV